MNRKGEEHSYAERAEECRAIAGNQQTISGRAEWTRLAQMYQFMSRELDCEQIGRIGILIPGG